jgi:hypothetical protein
MPEIPDFDQIARTLLARLTDPTDPFWTPALRAIAEQLRVVWNARGDADLVELEAAFAGVSPSMKVIDPIIRALDR